MSADVDCVKRKRKYTKTFTGEDRAKVGQFAAKNKVTRVQSRFKAMNLSESTIRHQEDVRASASTRKLETQRR